MNTLKFKKAASFRAGLPTFNFIWFGFGIIKHRGHTWNNSICRNRARTSQMHAQVKREPWLTSFGEIRSGNATDEQGEVPSNARKPRMHKRRQRTVAATNQSGSSRSPLNRSHL